MLCIACPAVYRRYIILFLNGVNRDQEDALKQMKFARSGVSSSLFDTIDVSKGLITLAQIKLDTTSKFLMYAYTLRQFDSILCSYLLGEHSLCTYVRTSCFIPVFLLVLLFVSEMEWPILFPGPHTTCSFSNETMTMLH